MRVFVGIPISEELRGRVLEWRGKYLTLTPNPSPKGRGETSIRWIEPKNLHVTLVPPWESQNWQVESSAVAKALADKQKLKVIKCGAFEIKFDKVCLKPENYHPRPVSRRLGTSNHDASRGGTIWATGEAGEEIRKLKNLIEMFLNINVDKTRGHAFYQHVTLARLRTPPCPLFGKEGETNLPQKINWRQKVTSVVLYRSHLLSSGADYEVLEEFMLGASTKYENSSAYIKMGIKKERPPASP